MMMQLVRDLLRIWWILWLNRVRTVVAANGTDVNDDCYLGCYRRAGKWKIIVFTQKTMHQGWLTHKNCLIKLPLPGAFYVDKVSTQKRVCLVYWAEHVYSSWSSTRFVITSVDNVYYNLVETTSKYQTNHFWLFPWHYFESVAPSDC